MTTSNLSREHLLNPATMWETLEMAYRFTLDEMDFPDGSRLLPDDPYRRLDESGQKELGRRLAAYAFSFREFYHQENEQKKGLTGNPPI